MNDRIRLGFRNIAAVSNESLASGQRFPVEVDASKKAETYLVYHFNNNQALYEAFLSELADFIIKSFEEKLILYFSKKYRTDGKPFQKKELLCGLNELEQVPYFSKENKKCAVLKGLSIYFAEKNSANVKGLVTFRLREYLRILEKTAAKLTELYENEREYQEFISLLKYFVNVQDERPEVVHLVVDSACIYSLFDENKRDITEKSIREFMYPLDTAYENYDDLLLSILITLAPKKLVVHRPKNMQNKELLDTIISVFSNVNFCENCQICEGKE